MSALFLNFSKMVYVTFYHETLHALVQPYYTEQIQGGGFAVCKRKKSSDQSFSPEDKGKL